MKIYAAAVCAYRPNATGGRTEMSASAILEVNEHAALGRAWERARELWPEAGAEEADGWAVLYESGVATKIAAAIRALK